MFGLQSNGLVLPRYADFLDMMIDAYEVETGVKINREPGDVLYSLLVVLARQDDAQMQMLQAVYDAQDPDNATGVQLDLLASISGISRFRAAPSRATATLVGDAATTLLQGRVVEDQNGVWWSLENDVVLDNGGTASGVFVCDVEGPTSATTGVDLEIVTPVAGWDSAQFDGITAGRLQESDADLRLRRVQGLQIRGTASVKSIRARLLAIPTIKAASIVENDTPNTQTISGIPNIPPHSIVPVILTNNSSGEFTPGVDDDEIARVARVLFEHVVAGIQCYGTDQSGVVTGEGGSTKTIAWNYTTQVPVTVSIVVMGVAATSVQHEIQQRVIAYFGGLRVGDAVRRLAILHAIGEIQGVIALDVLLDGNSSDIVLNEAAIGTLSGSVVVSN